MTNSTEIPLTGGNTNTVVRVGNTVRRTPSQHDATHTRLLKHVRKAGFGCVPEPLGTDAQGRSILSFMEGDTVFPADLWTNDAPLKAAVHLLRRLHVATEGFDTEGATWAQQNAPAEVICHNDFAPYNLIFRDGLPVAVIDFDVCGPGPRLRDLAYLAYWLVPLSFAADDLAPLTQAQAASGYPRLHSLMQCYGTADIDGLLLWVGRVLDTLASFDQMQEMFDHATARKLEAEGHLSHWRREASAFHKALPALKAAVG